MEHKKRKRLNLTPVAFGILGGVGVLFLYLMAEVSGDALTQSWDSALLFVAVFIAVVRIVLFCLDRWYYQTPSKHKDPEL